MEGIFSGRQQSHYIRETNQGQKTYMEGLREIQEYCQTQPHLEEYLGNADSFYFLIYADGSQEETPAFAYLVEEMGKTPELVEQWTASHGGSYAVYYFEGAFPFS